MQYENTWLRAMLHSINKPNRTCVHVEYRSVRLSKMWSVPILQPDGPQGEAVDERGVQSGEGGTQGRLDFEAVMPHMEAARAYVTTCR